MIQQSTNKKRLGQIFKRQAIVLGTFVLIIWIIEIIDLLFFNNNLNGLGVRPRTFGGLIGIFLMPFLHNGLGHVFSNTIPFIILGWLVMLRRTADFFLVSFIIILVSGLGVWLLGASNTVHIGASGLVFGYFGFLIIRSYFERSIYSILITVFVILIYGGLIWGVFPSFQSGVSWLGHFFGFLGGTYAAYLISKRVSNTENQIRLL